MNARNNFKNILYFIKEEFEKDPFVNTIVYGRSEQGWNVYKNVQYPLVHIIPSASPFINNNVNRITFSIGIMEQRDILDTHEPNRFDGGDNLIDNHNLCYSIYNNFISKIWNKFDNIDIDVIEVTPVNFFFFGGVDSVDGVDFTITLEIPNIEICFD